MSFARRAVASLSPRHNRRGAVPGIRTATCLWEGTVRSPTKADEFWSVSMAEPGGEVGPYGPRN